MSAGDHQARREAIIGRATVSLTRAQTMLLSIDETRASCVELIADIEAALTEARS